MRSQKWVSFRGGLGSALEMGGLDHPEGAWNTAATPPHPKESAEVDQASGQLFQAYPTGRRPRGSPRSEGLYIPSSLEHLGTPPEELESVVPERDVWVSLLDPLPLQPDLR